VQFVFHPTSARGFAVSALALAVVAACSKTPKPEANETTRAPSAEAHLVSAGEFAQRAPAALCHALSTCQNEEAAGMVTSMTYLALYGAMGSMRPGMEPDLDDISQRMRMERRTVFREPECLYVVRRVMSLAGPASLAPNAAPRFHYDAAAAYDCLAAMAAPFSPCSDAKKVDDHDISVDDLQRFAKQYGDAFSAHFGACRGTMPFWSREPSRPAGSR
jgi:hypothetical protein